jgi:hypothetical protein
MIKQAKVNRDKLTRREVHGLARPHFDQFDTNKDGYLDLEELKQVGEWLNHHHRPGVPEPGPKK